MRWPQLKTNTRHTLHAVATWTAAIALLSGGKALAGRHDPGNMTLSLGGSLSYSVNYRKETGVEYEWDGEELRETKTERDERYTDWDATPSLSCGYFFWKGTEIGLSGSAMLTWYSETNRAGFSVYDAKLYAKHYFDNSSSYTPYLKLEGGVSWLETGTYKETDGMVAGAIGVEFLGMGSVTWYAEFTSEYKKYTQSLEGTEWQNRLYLGVTWYPSFGRKQSLEGSVLPQAAPAPDALSTLAPETRQWIEAMEKRWGKALERAERGIAPGAGIRQGG
jgi:hypothetical protein